jgi:hypothetical protein
MSLSRSYCSYLTTSTLFLIAHSLIKVSINPFKSTLIVPSEKLTLSYSPGDKTDSLN